MACLSEKPQNTPSDCQKMQNENTSLKQLFVQGYMFLSMYFNYQARSLNKTQMGKHGRNQYPVCVVKRRGDYREKVSPAGR